MKTTIMNLPNYLLFEILSFLSIDDCFSVCQTNLLQILKSQNKYLEIILCKYFIDTETNLRKTSSGNASLLFETHLEIKKKLDNSYGDIINIMRFPSLPLPIMKRGIHSFST